MPPVYTPDDTDVASILDSLGGDPEFQSIINKLSIVKMIQDLQQGGQRGVGDMLGEQRLRAQLVANSIPEGAQYYPGLEPGGLFDSIVSGLGGGASLEMGARKVNRVPLDTLGSGLSDALWAANQNANSGLSGQASPSMVASVNELIQQALDYATGKGVPSKATAAETAASSDRARVKEYSDIIDTGNRDFENILEIIGPNVPGQVGMPAGGPSPRASSKSKTYTGVSGSNKGMQYYNKKTGKVEGGLSYYEKATGGTVEGPALLHVGERSPKDKNYETSEVVLAAPGTVVAPIPKGMKVDENNALALILSQVIKNRAETAGERPRGRGGVRGMSRAADGVTTAYDSDYILGLLGAGNTLRANNQQYDLGQGNIGLGYAGLRNQRTIAGLSNQAQNASTEAQKYIARLQQSGKTNEYELARMNNAAALERQREANTAAAARDAAQTDWQYRVAQLQTQSNEKMSAQELAARRMEAANQLQYWMGQLGIGRGQLDLAKRSETFNELVRGVGESATPGVRAGRLPSSAY